jgi:HEAT repeat protein
MRTKPPRSTGILPVKNPCGTGAPPVFLFVLLSTLAFAQSTRPSNALSIEQNLSQLHSNDWIIQWESIVNLGELKAQEAIAPLHALLENPQSHPFLRAKSLVALAQIEGDKVLPQALAFAKNDDPVQRAAGATALGIIGADAGKPVIAQLLLEKSVEVRCQAIIAHARLEKAAAMPVILKALPQWDLALAATKALVYVNTPESWNKLLDLLDAKDVRVRAAALHALAQTKDPRAIPPILAKLAMTREDRAVLAAARSALASFPPEQLASPLLNAFTGADPALYAPSLSILAAHPSKETADRVAARLDILNQKAPEALPTAFKLLSKSDPDAYAKTFAQFANHADPDVRRAAIDALGKTQARGIDLFALLQDRLVDTDKLVRAAAYQTLRRAARGLPRGGIVAYLAKPLASEDKTIYYPALELLRERLGRPEVPAALVALDHFLAGGDAETRKLAAQTIETYADAAAMEALARAQGYPSPWLVIGPFAFEAANGTAAIDAPFPPETEINLKKTYDAGDGTQASWALVQANRSDGIIDLAFIYQREGQEPSAKTSRIAYATLVLNTPAERDGFIAITSRGATALWLNNQKLTIPAGDAYRVPIHLDKGPNPLLVKCAGLEARDWQFRLQLVDKDGKRLSGVTSSLPAAEAK